MRVVRLEASDRRLLATRYSGHGNSQRRMRSALAEAGAHGALARLDVLRRLERHIRIDLGSVCCRFERRDRPETHPLERLVIIYITEVRLSETGEEELWILLDRVDDIRELMEGRLVGEPGS